MIGDMSVNGNAGTLLNGPAWTSGQAGSGALSFDGVNDYVSVADAPALRLANQMTVAFWFKKNAEKSDWVRLVGRGDSNNRNYGVWEAPGAGKRILFQCFPATRSMINFYSTVNTEVGVWYHVACTYDGNTGVWCLQRCLDERFDPRRLYRRGDPKKPFPRKPVDRLKLAA